MSTNHPLDSDTPIHCNRILFLNPEPKSVCGTGDSEMLRFVPYCSKSKVCSSLFDLERVLDDMLRSSI